MPEIKLLSQIDRHPKIKKNMDIGVLTAVMHLAPAKSSGYEVCPMRSAGCTKSCLNYAGFKYSKKQTCREKRTRFYFEDRPAFMRQLAAEIYNVRMNAIEQGFLCGVRLNATSDIMWERVPFIDENNDFYPNIMARFPNVCFMDYTKIAKRSRELLPDNYRLVFSRSEDNQNACLEAARNGMNIAAVFRGPDLPKFLMIPGSNPFGTRRFHVIDGDEHDWRYGEYDWHDAPVVIGLRAKGPALHDRSGFVIDDPAFAEGHRRLCEVYA